MYRLELIIALLIGAVFMCALLSIQMKWYKIARWKSVIVSLAIVVTGLIGAKILFFIENGYWKGRSFYGAIFFSPIVFYIIAKIIQISYLYALDFCATAGCLIFGILKIQCLIDGCCEGVILYIDKDYRYVRFPSQLVEFLSAFLLVGILMVLSYRPRFRGRIYPITLIMYGTVRFVLNLFRNDWERTQKLNLPLPWGNIWSLVAIIVGIIWLIVVKKKSKSK